MAYRTELDMAERIVKKMELKIELEMERKQRMVMLVLSRAIIHCLQKLW